jgi:hypothetical protein
VSASKFRIKLIGAWPRAEQTFRDLPARAMASARATLSDEAESLRAKVQEEYQLGAPGGKKFAPLSPLTLALRGKGRGVLRRTDTMLSEIVVVRDGDSYAVTVRGSREKIADIHSKGRTFKRPLTPKQRRYLFAAMRAKGIKPGEGRPRGGPLRDQSGRFLSKEQRAALVGMTVIPPRPFIEPTAARYLKKVKSTEKRMGRQWIANMGLGVGRSRRAR